MRGLDVKCTEDDDVVAYALDGEVQHVRVLSGEVVRKCEGTSGCDVVSVCEGKRTACVAKDKKPIILFDGEGNIAITLKGHSSDIHNMCGYQTPTSC